MWLTEIVPSYMRHIEELVDPGFYQFFWKMLKDDRVHILIEDVATVTRHDGRIIGHDYTTTYQGTFDPEEETPSFRRVLYEIIMTGEYKPKWAA